MEHLNGKTFYQIKSQYYRKGLIYKHFTIKQLDSQNIRPTMDEREQLMNIYNDFKNDGDSSDMDEDEAKNLIMKKDLVDLNLGDKIYIKEGELQGSHGVIKNFGDNRNEVVFKPTNIDGWDDNLSIAITMVVKYFEVGDCVKVIDGRYSGETAIVTKVNEEDISMPSIRLEDSNRELQLNTCYL